MDTFSYSTDEAKRVAHARSLQIAIPFAFAVIFMLLATYFILPQGSVSDLISTSLMIVGIAIVVGFFSIRSAARSVASLGIILAGC